MKIFSSRPAEPHIPEVEYKGKESTGGDVYQVYRAPSRSRALDFLRGIEVREERTYVIVETPEGNFGKDLIMIFDESTSEKIEFGHRAPLPRLRRSKTKCTRCGYPVLPADHRWPGRISAAPSVLEDLRDGGVGFYCTNCQAAWCPFCLTAEAAAECELCGTQMELLWEPHGGA